MEDPREVASPPMDDEDQALERELVTRWDELEDQAFERELVTRWDELEDQAFERELVSLAQSFFSEDKENYTASTAAPFGHSTYVRSEEALEESSQQPLVDPFGESPSPPQKKRKLNKLRRVTTSVSLAQSHESFGVDSTSSASRQSNGAAGIPSTPTRLLKRPSWISDQSSPLLCRTRRTNVLSATQGIPLRLMSNDMVGKALTTKLLLNLGLPESLIKVEKAGGCGTGGDVRIVTSKGDLNVETKVSQLCQNKPGEFLFQFSGISQRQTQEPHIVVCFALLESFHWDPTVNDAIRQKFKETFPSKYVAAHWESLLMNVQDENHQRRVVVLIFGRDRFNEILNNNDGFSFRPFKSGGAELHEVRATLEEDSRIENLFRKASLPLASLLDTRGESGLAMVDAVPFDESNDPEYNTEFINMIRTSESLVVASYDRVAKLKIVDILMSLGVPMDKLKPETGQCKEGADVRVTGIGSDATIETKMSVVGSNRDAPSYSINNIRGNESQVFVFFGIMQGILPSASKRIQQMSRDYCANHSELANWNDTSMNLRDPMNYSRQQVIACSENDLDQLFPKHEAENGGKMHRVYPFPGTAQPQLRPFTTTLDKPDEVRALLAKASPQLARMIDPDGSAVRKYDAMLAERKKMETYLSSVIANGNRRQSTPIVPDEPTLLSLYNEAKSLARKYPIPSDTKVKTLKPGTRQSHATNIRFVYIKPPANAITFQVSVLFGKRPTRLQVCLNYTSIRPAFYAKVLLSHYRGQGLTGTEAKSRVVEEVQDAYPCSSGGIGNFALGGPYSVARGDKFYDLCEDEDSK